MLPPIACLHKQTLGVAMTGAVDSRLLTSGMTRVGYCGNDRNGVISRSLGAAETKVVASELRVKPAAIRRTAVPEAALAAATAVDTLIA